MNIVFITSLLSDEQNILYLADADGSHAKKMTLSVIWAPDIVEAPMFEPDDRSILFSALVPSETDMPNWGEKLLGIQVGNAEMPPSEWISVSMFGGRVPGLTIGKTSGLCASISPDERFIARCSADGLSVMNVDRGGLTTLLNDTGSIIWKLGWIPCSPVGQTSQSTVLRNFIG